MKRLLLLALLLLVPSTAFAVTAVNRYVNTDCANNGDGTSASCAASPGASGAYNSLEVGLNDIQSDNANFVTADIQVTVHCKGAAADTSEPDVNTSGGFTLNSTHYLSLTADVGDRHDGKWNTGKYRIVNSNYYAALRLTATYVRVSWLQIENAKTGASPGTESAGIRISGVSTGGFLLIENNLIRYTGDYTNQLAPGIDDEFDDTSVTKVVRGNIIYDFNRGGYFRTGDSGTYYLYNNTCYSSAASGDTCFVIRDYGSGTITYVAKNNLAQGSLAGYDIDGNGVYTHSNNLSLDASSPDSSLRSKTVAFNNAGTRDLHLASSDTSAKDAGVDLSGATQGFSNDIDNQTRSGSWDIGADEYQAGGGGGGSSAAVKVILSIWRKMK